MTEPPVSVCAVESDRLLVFLEAALAVKTAATGLTLPAPLVAALHELDQLASQLHEGAQVYLVDGPHSGYGSDYFAYRASLELSRDDPSFYGLVMAAMRKGDTRNAEILRRAFPAVWADLQARYDAPGGVLATDPAGLRARILGEGSA